MTEQNVQNKLGNLGRSLGLNTLVAFEFANGIVAWFFALVIGTYWRWGADAQEASVVFLLWGLVPFTAAYSIWNGKSWGWAPMLMLNGLRVIATLSLLVTIHLGILLGLIGNVSLLSTSLGAGMFFLFFGSSYRFGSDVVVLGFAIFYLLIVWFLWRPDTRAYFGRKKSGVAGFRSGERTVAQS